MTAKARANGKPTHAIAVTDWSAVRIEPVNWLMIDRIPLSELTIVEGDGGLGKTTAVLDLAARVSTGRAMPDRTPFDKPANVVLVAEEDRTSILKARFRAAGADLARVHHVASIGENGARFSLPSHGRALYEFVAQLGARLVIIDAMFNHIDEGLKIASSEDVRRMLAPLTELAHLTGAAVIGIRHWGKAARSAASRGLGSVDITNLSRSVLAVGRHPSDERLRVMAVAKSNLGADRAAVRSLTFAIEAEEIVDEIDERVSVSIGRVAWGDEAEISADDLANAVEESGEERSQVDAARDLIREVLADGPVLAKDVQQRLAAEGFNRRLWFRAKRKAGIVSDSVPGSFPRQTTWALPVDGSRARTHDRKKDVTTVTTVIAVEASSSDSGDVLRSDRARVTIGARTRPLPAERNGRSSSGRRCRGCGHIHIVRLPAEICEECCASVAR